jgi:hypothetical protein
MFAGATVAATGSSMVSSGPSGVQTFRSSQS